MRVILKQERAMMPTDWAALWRELATSDIQASAEGEAQMICLLYTSPSPRD